MEILNDESWLTRLKNFLPELMPRPNSGRWWLDTLFIFFLVILQKTILNSIFGAHIAIDLITPWLVVGIVGQHGFSAFLVTMTAAAILETHSTIPAGSYFCSYWIMYNVIMTIRPTLSWRHSMPWLAAFGLSELWIIIFENLMSFFSDGLSILTWDHIFNLVIRFGITIGVGQMLWLYRMSWDDEVLPK